MTDKVQIVGLGLATLDVLIRTQNMPDWEHGGRFDAFGFDGGGPVGTAMCAASRLGARVGFVGTAGNDHVADLKVELLAEFDMDLSHLVRRDQPEDQVVIVYVDSQTGERVFSGFGARGRICCAPTSWTRTISSEQTIFILRGCIPRRRCRRPNGDTRRVSRWCSTAARPESPTCVRTCGS